ncbi:MAG TPA: adenylate/guanylate cyclase domain-containing protein [Myxococcaceae bacterium]|nr:adenylate/guanylate cyclase domain-containing protein [Myxococcaceae bacterium]
MKAAVIPLTQVVASTVLRGPRLSGRLPDGRVGDFDLAEKNTLGRHANNTLRLVDREVSKEHASIERMPAGGFLLRDLGSSNGTFVNGRRVKELNLREGDEISLGNSRLVFHEGQKGGSSSPNVTVVASDQSMPAFLAQIEHVEEAEFRPAEKLTDIGALRLDYEKLRIAHEFHRQVGLERDQRSLLDKIINVAFQLLAADNAVLFLVDQRTGSLVPQMVRNRRKDSEEVIVSETVLKRVIETRQAVLTADAIIDSRFKSSESIVAQGIRSAMAVPLLTKGDLKGVLFLDTRERTNAFSEKDLKILSGIASQAAIALENADLARKIETEAVTRAELSRFLSPAVAEMVVKGQVELLRAGRLAEVSVLFADIRGFTTMAESESPQETVLMLNSFFTAMAQVIFRNEGNLDKFIGDCVMAVWGSPSSHPDDAARALRAAMEMQAETEALNRTRTAAGQRPISIGVGVNTGQAVVGYMGSSERHEYTAIGDSVNIAARLCGMAKPGEVLATESSVKMAGRGFEATALPAAQVKGKEKGVVIYKVTGVEASSTGE